MIAFLAIDNRITRYMKCKQGHMALIAALLAPMLLGTLGGAIDVHAFLTYKSELQDIADAAALGAAKEASLNGWSSTAALAIADGYLKANQHPSRNETTTAQVQVDAAKKQIKVILEQDHHPYFVVGYFAGSPQIRVSSVAQTNNSSNICVIGLDPADAATVSLETNATISAPKCAVYSNSVSTSGLTSTGNANLIGQLVCSAGGYSGLSKNFNNEVPLTDCPVVVDPLASRLPPQVGNCRQTDAAYQHYIGVLQPGVYCGGLTIKASSKVILKPGVYVIKDGPLVIESSSIVSGKGVGFFFTGKNASLVFGSSSQVDIEAPTSGPLAGLVTFQDRASPEADFIITSNKARKLLGTIYLANGNLIVDANNKVADASAYTAIVVRRLRLSKGPNLVLNTNYGGTSVPVPEGVGPQSSTARLIF